MAHSVARVIHKQMLDTIALKLLEGEFHDGDTIKVDADGIGFLFSRVVEGEVVAA